MKMSTIYSQIKGKHIFEIFIKSTFIDKEIKRLECKGYAHYTVTTRKKLFKNEELIFVLKERPVENSTLDIIKCSLSESLYNLIKILRSDSYNFVDKDFLLNRLCEFLMSVNTQITISTNKKKHQDFDVYNQMLTEQFDGICQITNMKDKIFKSFFYNKEMKLIIDQEGNSETSEFSKKTEPVTSELSDLDKIRISNKNSNEIILKEKGINPDKFVPCYPFGDKFEIREIRSIADRIYCLFYFVCIGISLEDEKLAFFKEQLDINNFSNMEKMYLKDKALAKLNKPIFATWIENINTLLWVITKVDKLKFPDEYPDVKTIFDQLTKLTKSKIIESNTTRSMHEILKELDLTYRLQEHCVTDYFDKEKNIMKIDYNILSNRMQTLNWIIDASKGQWN